MIFKNKIDITYLYHEIKLFLVNQDSHISLNNWRDE